MGKPIFINYPLSQDDKKALRKWADEHEADFARYEEQVAGQGYKCSFSMNVANDSYNFTITSAEVRGGEDGYILSTWSNELWKARAEALWLHFIVADSDWSNLIDVVQSSW